jgi:hypothetical protein
MTTVVEIERAVEQLSPSELSAFRAWFAEHDAAQWDRQLEADIIAGRLDAPGEKALADARQGRCTDL